MGTKAFGWLKIFLKFSFSFLILAYMVYSGRLELSVVQKGFSHIGLLIGVVVLIMVALTTSTIRWGLLMRGQNIPIETAHLIRYSMIGAFFNTTMPGAVSGDLIKTWYVVADRPEQKKTPILASVLLDRVLGVFGLILVSASPIFLFWGTVWSEPHLSHLAGIVLLLFLGVLLFFLYVMSADWGPIAHVRRMLEVIGKYKAGRMLLDAYDAWMIYRKVPRILVQSILLSMATHVAVVLAVILCARALGEQNLALYQYFLLAPIGLLSTAIPIAPAGLGVGQIAFAALFALGGSSLGAEIFTMLVTLQILLNLTGVFFYLSSPKIVPPQP